MESFKSNPHAIACSAATIYSKLTNPSLIKQLIEAHADRIDETAREHLDTVRFSEDAIAIQSPMGEVTLSLDHDNSIEGERIVYTASSSPVPINMVINLEAQPDDTTMCRSSCARWWKDSCRRAQTASANCWPSSPSTNYNQE